MVHVSGGLSGAVPELRLDGVSVRQGRRLVVEDLTWAHAAGRIAWLVGENGTGKSSLLRVMAGRARPSAGTVTLRDPAGRTRERIYYKPAMRLPGGVRAQEWSRLMDRLAGLGAAEVEEPLAALRPDVPADRLLGRVSTGEAKRMLLEALLRKPVPFVFLDEPYEHLSGRARGALTEALVARARTAVVVVATNQPIPAHAAGPVVQLDGERPVVLEPEEAPWKG
ncbi:MAG: ATP-binding cassette domain-containing protein [Gemmatimonadota bacterium]|mgnify:FL=1|jgi:ABC-type transport system involved in cytochrome c biogenesis ATPase subunit